MAHCADGDTVYPMAINVRYDYPVCFTTDLFSPDNRVLVDAVCRKEANRRHRAIVFVDRGVADSSPGLLASIVGYADRHGDRLRLVSDPVVLEGGEASKNDPMAPLGVHELLNARGMDRQSFVIVIGGGALLDMVGYAAATAHRGLRIVRVPTTVLAQDDSGVGVKNGINAFGKKNFLGAFAPPFAVLNDDRFLETLSHRDKIAGMAEAVKVALIHDADFFSWIVEHAPALAACQHGPMNTLIRRCARLHMEHIATSGDPFEFGSARPLDFGHWAAHKLETLTQSRLRHGEAVAIGIAIDTMYSVETGLLDAASLTPVLDVLSVLGFDLWDGALEMEAPGGRRLVLDGLAEFAEHLGGELTVTMLEAIGKGVEVHEVRAEVVLHVLDRLREMQPVR